MAILADTTRDTLLGGRVTIFQPARGYRAAIDPVMLAAAVPARSGEAVLDAAPRDDAREVLPPLDREGRGQREDSNTPQFGVQPPPW